MLTHPNTLSPENFNFIYLYILPEDIFYFNNVIPLCMHVPCPIPVPLEARGGFSDL